MFQKCQNFREDTVDSHPPLLFVPVRKHGKAVYYYSKILYPRNIEDKQVLLVEHSSTCFPYDLICNYS